MNLIVKILIISIIIMVLDMIWLYSNSYHYNLFVRKVQGSDINLNFFSGFISYLFAFIGLFTIIIPLVKYKFDIKKLSLFELLAVSLRYGGGFAIILYTVLHATNDAIFKNYDIKIALMDTIWGFTLYSLALFIYLILEKYYQ